MTSLQVSGDMKQAQRFSFTDIPPYLLLAAFNLWLGYALVTDPNSRLGSYLQSKGIADNDPVSRLVGLVLLLTGIFIISFRPAGRNAFAASATPVVLYNITTATFIPGDAPNACIVVIVFALIYMWQNFEFDAFKQAAETYATRSHDEQASKDKQIADLKQGATTGG